MPVTTPVLVTVAIPPAPELQAPPLLISLNTVDEPVHIAALPVIAAGAVLIVMGVTALQPVGSV
jgi:hypothetical protein